MTASAKLLAAGVAVVVPFVVAVLVVSASGSVCCDNHRVTYLDYIYVNEQCADKYIRQFM